MINNLFDKHIKEQLGTTRPDVPAHVWENIVAAKERKKPVGFFTTNLFKMVAAILLIIGVGTIIYVCSSKNNIEKNIETVNETAPVNNQDKTDLQNKNNEIAKPTEKLTADLTKTNKNSFDADQNVTDNKTLVNTNSNTNVVINHPHLLYNNEVLGVTNQPIQYLSSTFILNDLKKKTVSFNPTLQFRQLPSSPFIPCPEAEKNTSGNKRYIEVYGGPDYVFHSLSDTANSVYLQQRKNSVKYLFAYSAGIRYTKVFNNGMSFRTGVNYSQVNEQFKSEKGRITQNVYTINNNGDTTGSYVQTGTQYKTSTNKYKSIDIPVSVGYELGNGRLHANINAGAMINIASSQKGFMLDNSGNVVDISSGKSNSVYRYKTKAGVSFIGATSIYYKLNEQLHLMAEPYIKLSLTPMTKPEISLKEKFHTTGVRVGVRMDF